MQFSKAVRLFQVQLLSLRANNADTRVIDVIEKKIATMQQMEKLVNDATATELHPLIAGGCSY